MSPRNERHPKRGSHLSSRRISARLGRCEIRVDQMTKVVRSTHVQACRPAVYSRDLPRRLLERHRPELLPEQKRPSDRYFPRWSSRTLTTFACLGHPIYCRISQDATASRDYVHRFLLSKPSSFNAAFAGGVKARYTHHEPSEARAAAISKALPAGANPTETRYPISRVIPLASADGILPRASNVFLGYVRMPLRDAKMSLNTSHGRSLFRSIYRTTK